GGRLATRSAGHASGKYGRLADMLVSVRLLSPAGIVQTRAAPATAAGPSLLQLLAGSEGTLGVIISATLRIWPLAQIVRQGGLLFKNFQQGAAAVRAILQQGLKASIGRL